MPPTPHARRHVALAAGTGSPRPVGTTQTTPLSRARKSPDALEAQSEEEVDELSLIDHNEIMARLTLKQEVGSSQAVRAASWPRERVKGCGEGNLEVTHTERRQPSADPRWPSCPGGHPLAPSAGPPLHPLLLAPCLGHCRCSRTLGTWATAWRKCAVPCSNTWRVSLGKWPVLHKPQMTGLWRLW